MNSFKFWHLYANLYTLYAWAMSPIKPFLLQLYYKIHIWRKKNMEMCVSAYAYVSANTKSVESV